MGSSRRWFVSSVTAASLFVGSLILQFGGEVAFAGETDPSNALGLIAAVPSRASTEGGTAQERDCNGVNAVIKVPVQNVAGVVPEGFDPDPDGDENAVLSITTVQCDGVSINGGEFQETTFAAFRVEVADPRGDGSSDDPLQIDRVNFFNSYQLWVVSDNRAFVDLFQDNGGTAVWVPGLEFSLDPAMGTFEFEAPPPTPSPFEMKADVTPFLFGLANLVDHFWGSAFPHGRMLEVSKIEAIALGLAEGVVEPQAGSEMDNILCGTPGTFNREDASVRLFFPTGSFSVELQPDDTGREGRATCDKHSGTS